MRILTRTILLTVLTLSCSDQGVDVNPAPGNTAWRLIPGMESIDVRYIIESGGSLYLAGVDSRKFDGEDGYGVVYSSADGEQWSLIKSLRRAVGPLASHNDTIYLLSDSLYMVIPTWRSICKPEPLTQDPSAIGDMIFLRDTIYAMQSYFGDVVATYRIDRDGTVFDIPVWQGRSYGGSKFMLGMEGGQQVAYVRGQYYQSGFYKFDGRTFTPIQDGLSQLEFDEPPTNSMGMKNDTLYAGFRFPGSVKFLANGRWYAYTDTMPYSRMYEQFGIATEPTAIAFCEGRLFVATLPLGVLEWTGSEWERLSEGLLVPPFEGIEDMYYAVVHLASFHNNLLAGYGRPGFAPWGRVGLFVLPIED